MMVFACVAVARWLETVDRRPAITEPPPPNAGPETLRRTRFPIRTGYGGAQVRSK